MLYSAALDAYWGRNSSSKVCITSFSPSQQAQHICILQQDSATTADTHQLLQQRACQVNRFCACRLASMYMLKMGHRMYLMAQPNYPIQCNSVFMPAASSCPSARRDVCWPLWKRDEGRTMVVFLFYQVFAAARPCLIFYRRNRWWRHSHQLCRARF